MILLSSSFLVGNKLASDMCLHAPAAVRCLFYSANMAILASWWFQPIWKILVKLSQPCEAIKATLLLNLPLQESQHKSNTSTRVVLLKEGCKSLPTAVFRAKPWFLLLSQARCMSEMTLMNLQFDLHTSVKMQFGITFVSTKNSWEKQL